MRRPMPKEIGGGHDSFLDVVSNMVGILIILVVLVGSQVKFDSTEMLDTSVSSSHSVSHDKIALNPELPNRALGDNEDNTEKEAALAHIQQQIGMEVKNKNMLLKNLSDMEQQLNAITELTATVSLQEEQLKKRKAAVMAQSQRDDRNNQVRNREMLALNEQLLQRQKILAQLKERLRESEKMHGAPHELRHKQTPISRNIEGHEVHFIVKNDRILYIPMNELIEIYQRRMSQLLLGNSRTDTVGPVKGFMLRVNAKMDASRPEIFWQLIMPVEGGESREMALAPVSDFRRNIESLKPTRDVITLWVYPSGFRLHREIKDFLYQLGYSIAVRPLPEGYPIEGSPYGQRSVAQ